MHRCEGEWALINALHIKITQKHVQRWTAKTRAEISIFQQFHLSEILNLDRREPEDEEKFIAAFNRTILKLKRRQWKGRHLRKKSCRWPWLVESRLHHSDGQNHPSQFRHGIVQSIGKEICTHKTQKKRQKRECSAFTVSLKRTAAYRGKEGEGF